MVDADARASSATFDIMALDAEGRARYRAFATGKVKGAAQHPLWVEAWIEAQHVEGVAIAMRQEDTIVAIWPLEIMRQGRVRIARFVAGGHANGNFPAIADACPPLGAQAMRRLRQALRKARPDIDILLLERQQKILAGQTNPLASLSSRPSTNIALAMDLSGGFAEALARANGKKKQKKRRVQLRRFEALGAHAVATADDAQRIDAVLERFYELKSERFRRIGVRDVFADPQVRAALRAIFLRSLDEPDRPFVLEALEVAGVIRSVNGTTRLADRTVCDFGAIADDELTSISPGEYLTYSSIEEAAGRGDALYDFSVGDEAYKRSWCDVEIVQFDTIVPLSPSGVIAAGSNRVLGAAKRRVKSNKVLWPLIQKLRRGA